MKLYHLHGMDSSPDSYKARHLARFFPDLIVPHLTNDVLERRAFLEREITAPVFLSGSSLGGLSALDFASRNPQLVKGMVLLAPAVGFFDNSNKSQEILDYLAELRIPSVMPVVVIAALRDDIIPIDSIRNLVTRSESRPDLELIELDDDHRLNEPPSLAVFVESVQKVTGQLTP